MDDKSLEVNIQEFLNADSGLQKCFNIFGIIESDLEIKYLKLVEAKVLITKVEGGIVADLDVKVQIELICSKCAKRFVKNLCFKIDRVYDFRPLENADYIVIDDQFIDFSTLIHDEVILSLPIKILCKKNCLGVKNATTKKTDD